MSLISKKKRFYNIILSNAQTPLLCFLNNKKYSLNNTLNAGLHFKNWNCIFLRHSHIMSERRKNFKWARIQALFFSTLGSVTPTCPIYLPLRSA